LVFGAGLAVAFAGDEAAGFAGGVGVAGAFCAAAVFGAGTTGVGLGGGLDIDWPAEWGVDWPADWGVGGVLAEGAPGAERPRAEPVAGGAKVWACTAPMSSRVASGKAVNRMVWIVRLCGRLVKGFVTM